MRRFERNGTEFTVFQRDGETYLCTGNPSGRLKFAFIGEICDYCTVEGATSVVFGDGSIEELYNKWLSATEFYRSIGVKY